jgi:hypothetical protein
MSEIKTLTKVESSMLYAVGYDPKSKTLEVVFTKGNIWQYYDVPQDVYDDMINSKSIGSYMRSCIIDCYEDSPY